ncbi:MAG: hypothetical protein M3Z92_00205 [Bacteroidota bacterium]|nr:hypothetical protein [Bacteroidota bacterium]MDQ6889315.1 hypothetical protein [Bacteroidota bacterium]
MKKSLPDFFIFLLFSLPGFSQLLTWSSNFIQESSTPVVITVDAANRFKESLNIESFTHENAVLIISCLNRNDVAKKAKH